MPISPLANHPVRVAVISGGPGPEHAVSLGSGRAIADGPRVERLHRHALHGVGGRCLGDRWPRRAPGGGRGASARRRRHPGTPRTVGRGWRRARVPRDARASRTSGAACWPPRPAWTRPARSGCSPTPGSSVAPGRTVPAPLDAAAGPGPGPGPRVAAVRQAGRRRIELRRHARHRRGRPACGRRGGRAVRRPGPRRARACAAARSTWRSSSCPAASASPARPSRSGPTRPSRSSRRPPSTRAGDPVPRARAGRRRAGGDARGHGAPRVRGPRVRRSGADRRVRGPRPRPGGQRGQHVPGLHRAIAVPADLGRGRTRVPRVWSGPSSTPR